MGRHPSVARHVALVTIAVLIASLVPGSPAAAHRDDASPATVRDALPAPTAAVVTDAGSAVIQDTFRWTSVAVMANGLPILAYSSRRPFVSGGAVDEDGYTHPRVASYLSQTSIAAPVVVDDPAIVGHANGYDNISAVDIATNGAGGLILVTFVDPALSRTVVRRSTDLGATWSAVETIAPLASTVVSDGDIRGHYHHLYFDTQSALFYYSYALSNQDQIKYVTTSDGTNWSAIHYWGTFYSSNGANPFQSRVTRFFRTHQGTWLAYGNVFNNNGEMSVARFGNGVCDTVSCFPTQQIELWTWDGQADTTPPNQEQRYVLHTPGSAFYLPNSATPERIHLIFGATALTGFHSIPQGHLFHWWSDDDGVSWSNENGGAGGGGLDTSLLGAADAETPIPEPATGPLGDIDAAWIPSFGGELHIWGVEANSNNVSPGLSVSRFADGVRDQTRVQGDGGYPTTARDAGESAPYAFGIYGNASFSKEPINLATGSLTAHADDLVLPGRVLPFAFTRWYNSADATTGALGPAWTHTYNWKLTDSGATVEVRRGDGRRDAFTRNPDGTYADAPNVFDVLVKNGDGTFTLTLTSQVQYEFTAAGQLTRLHEPAGNQLTLTYTGANLTGITDTVGRQITLTYNGSNLAQVQDPLGRKVTYAYDANGRLSTVTDKIGNAPGQNPALHRWTYGYEGATRHITTITDPDGRVRVTNTYDTLGRVHEQRDALNALTRIDYSAGQTGVTDPRQHATTYTFDSRMRVLTRVDTVGANTYTITYVYDAVGNRTSVTDRNGKTTDLTYDERGNVLTKTDPEIDPQTPRYLTRFEYDSKNNLRLVTDARGFATTLTYDPTTNVPLSVSRQIDGTTSAVTKYEYTDGSNPGLPTKVISPRGNTGPTPNYTFSMSLTYDVQGNLSQRIDPDGAKTTFAYDGAGRLSSFVDPDGYAPGANPLEHTWSIGYDENDHEKTRTDPLGNVLAYGYDGAGNRATVTDRRGNITVYVYDLNVRLERVEQKPDPVGQPNLVYMTRVTTRDGNGNATRITQANGVVTDYTFDALDRLTSVSTHPDAQTTLTTSYVLDGNGQPTSRTTGDNVTVAYTYDALSRLWTVSGPSLSVGYAYDPTSQRTQMTDATGTTIYQYDGLGRVTQVAAPNGTLTYVYDLDGNRTTLGYPGSQNVTYAYSPGGRLNTVTDWASRLSTYTYKPSGLVATLSYPNTMLASYTYDRAQRLTQVTNAVGATTITQHTYTLDAEGNRTALDEYVQGITQPIASWSASVRVNDVATGQQDRPDIALGADGATYLIWEDLRAGAADVFFSRRDPVTGSWSANQKVTDDTTSIHWNPAIALDASNNAYAVWSDRRTGTIKNPDTDIFFSKRSAATGVWSANVQVNDDTSGKLVQGTARIAVKSAGDAVSVWEDHRSNQWNVYSSRLPAGSNTWAANIRVTDNTVSRKFTPDVAMGADGTAYAVWEDDRSGNSDIWFSTLPAGASNWTANVKISDDPGSFAQYDPQIGISAAGDLIVIWQDDRVPNTEVRMRRRLAGQANWQASIVASDAAAIPVSLALGVRADGNAFAAWQDARGSSYDIWGADYTFATNSWSASTLVSDDPASTAQMRPAAALSMNEVALAWRDDRVTGGDIRARRRASTQGVDHFAFTYDGLNRLGSATGAVAESFVFDGATNIASRTGPSATNGYDGANRQTSDGTRSFVWSNADRLIQRGSDTFIYDPLGRLTSATVTGNTRAYTPNGDGLLSSGAGTSYLWDMATAPAALVQAGTDKVIDGLGALYAVRPDGSTYAFARDGLGSVRAELNGSGSTTRSIRYTAYGAIAQTSGGSPTLFGFTGELVDASGLTYLRSRWYDPATGRFMTHDEFAGRLCRPASLNGYTYAYGRPSRFMDPLGFDPETPCDSLLGTIEQLSVGMYRKIAEYLVGPKPPTYGTVAGHRDYFESLRRGLTNARAKYVRAGCDSSKMPADLESTLSLENPWGAQIPAPGPDSSVFFIPDDAIRSIGVGLAGGAILLGGGILIGGFAGLGGGGLGEYQP